MFRFGLFLWNTQNYSHFRGTYFWKELIIEEYRLNICAPKQYPNKERISDIYALTYIHLKNFNLFFGLI